MASRDKKSGTPQRQIILPLRVAIRIAYENIRMRLTRSLLVTSGITLAVAFLISILVGNLTVRGMREWVSSTVSSPRFAMLQKQRKDLELKLPALAEAAHRNKTDGEAAKTWKDATGQLTEVRAELDAPLQLESIMKKNGVPATADEIASDRIQTRWLLGLALLVAFIGILNSMLMSVTERFREIGTMKCLGALDGFIVRLFLLESLFQGIVGTVAGIVIGVTLSLLEQFISYGSFTWKNILVGNLIESIIFCFLIGLGLTVAGAIYPAWQAARMQPIAAMRVEF